MEIKIKRVYESWLKSDGYRVLVDRLWPRGISKEEAHIDFWDKNIAPDTELRKWFNHEPEKFPEFKKQYLRQLNENEEALQEFRAQVKGKKKISLIYGAKNPEINHALVLRDFLEKKLK